MPLGMQAKLLRALKERSVRPVGGDAEGRLRRSYRRGHEPRPRGRGPQGCVPRRPLLPDQRRAGRSAAATRTARTMRWRSAQPSSSARTRTATVGSSATRARRPSGSRRILGRGTYESCRTAWSAPWRSPSTTTSASRTSPSWSPSRRARALSPRRAIRPPFFRWTRSSAATWARCSRRRSTGNKASAARLLEMDPAGRCIESSSAGVLPGHESLGDRRDGGSGRSLHQTARMRSYVVFPGGVRQRRRSPSRPLFSSEAPRRSSGLLGDRDVCSRAYATT